MNQHKTFFNDIGTLSRSWISVLYFWEKLKNNLKFDLKDLTHLSAAASAVWSIMSSAVISLGN